MGLSTPCNAQNKRNALKRAKTTKAALIVNINTTIVDEDNRPIKDAEIITSEGAITHYTDKEGKVSIQSRANGIILVEALGYEDIIVDLAKEQFPKVLKMKKTEMLASGKYKIERPDGGVTYQKIWSVLLEVLREKIYRLILISRCRILCRDVFPDWWYALM